MKTTVEISDALIHRARALAAEQHLSLRELIEEGLNTAIAQRTSRAPHPLRDLRFGREGLTSEFANASWEQLRDEIYRGRGA